MVRKASTLLSDEQKASVETAVAEAEKKTSGEIVVVVATQSGRYDRGEDLFGVVTGLVFVTAGWFLLESIQGGSGTWSEYTLGLLPVLGLFVAGFIAGASLATYVPHLGLLFMTRKNRTEEVRRSAREAFFRFRIRRTDGASGTLIYVSLLEHIVWVVGDDSVNEKIPQAAWDEIRDQIIQGFSAKDAAGGLRNGIVRCGEVLAEHLPIQPGDVNELPNTVHFID